MEPNRRYQSALRNEKKRIMALRTEKYCRHCDTVKPLADFYQPSVSGYTGISCWCKECLIQYSRDRRKQRRIERQLREQNHP